MDSEVYLLVLAAREPIELLGVEGCVIVVGAMRCQKKTAALTVRKKADYLLNVKCNQPSLKKDVKEYVQDEGLRKTMGSHIECEKNIGRTKRCSALTTSDIDWLARKAERKGLVCIGAINARVTYIGKTTYE